MEQDGKPARILLLRVDAHLSSTKIARLGLDLHHDSDSLIPTIRLIDSTSGRVSLELAAWVDFQKYFTAIASYFDSKPQEKDGHSAVTGLDFILKYEVHEDKPVVIIQNQCKSDGSVPNISSFYRLTIDDFTELTAIQTHISGYMSWLSQIRGKAETCKKILVNVVADYSTSRTVGSVQRNIRRKYGQIRALARQEARVVRSSELSAPMKTSIIDDLLTHHRDHIVNTVINRFIF